MSIGTFRRQRLRPARGAKSPSESERGWGAASAVKCGLFAGVVASLAVVLAAGTVAQSAPRPSRIVSLIPAVTEMLFAIGAGDQVVGVGSFDRYPAQVKALPRVGALLDPDLEKILSLRPDLVAIYGTQTDLHQQLQRARVPIFLYSHTGLADVTKTMRELGQRVGRAAEAERAAADVETALEAVRRKVAGRTRPRVLLVFSRDAGTLRGIFASGGVGFLHDILEAAGGTNVFADVRRQSVQAGAELILARRPEVILEVRGFPIAAADVQAHRKDWQAIPAVPAVRRGRVRIIGDERTVVPGPRVAEAAQMVAAALHPEAFK